MCGVPARSRQALTARVSWVLWALSVIAVAARFAARSTFFDGVGFGMDDWMALVTEGFVTAIAICAYLMIHDGLGKDIWQLDPWNISSVLRWFWIEEMLYSFAVCLTKVSICLFYLRIFPETVSSRFRFICYVVIGCLVCQILGFVLSVAFACDPVSYTWTQWDGQHKGTCLNVMAQIYAGSAVNITMDLTVFVLPIPRLLKVQISTRKKVGICMTFLVGLFVTLCSIIRLYYVVHWRATTNPTWTNSPVGLWSLVEVDVGIICACMPALSGPLKKVWVVTVGRGISSLYASRKGRSESGEVISSSAGGVRSKTTNSSGWRSISRQGDTKPAGDSIMCNVSLNVSDEMELVDKSKGEGQAHAPGAYTHDYRDRW